MKPVKWISATGRNPCAASPTDMPAISTSESGVSNTRPGPKRSSSPTVARNTPPSTPTSSPSTSTLSSSAMARASARLTASTRVTSAIARLRLDFGALPGEVGGQGGEQVVEHGFRRQGRRRQIGLDRRLDRGGAVGEQALLVRLAPRPGTDEVGAQPGD